MLSCAIYGLLLSERDIPKQKILDRLPTSLARLFLLSLSGTAGQAISSAVKSGAANDLPTQA